MNSKKHMCEVAKFVKKATFPSSQKSQNEQNNPNHIQYSRLNFTLASSFLRSQKATQSFPNSLKQRFTVFHFYETKNKKPFSKRLSSIISNADKCCIKQDFHLLPYRKMELKDLLQHRNIFKWQFPQELLAQLSIRQYAKMQKQAHHHARTCFVIVEDPSSKKHKLANEEGKWKLWNHIDQNHPYPISQTTNFFSE